MSLKDSFDKTSLDIENPGIVGGPNRSNSYNIPGGIYTNNRSGNKYGNSPGGPLKDPKGKIITNTLNSYGPNNTYLESFSLPEPVIPPPPPLPPLPVQGPTAELISKVPPLDGPVSSLVKSQLK